MNCKTTTTAQSHRISKIAQEVVEVSNQLQQNEALNTRQVQVSGTITRTFKKTGQQFRINAV